MYLVYSILGSLPLHKHSMLIVIEQRLVERRCLLDVGPAVYRVVHVSFENLILNLHRCYIMIAESFLGASDTIIFPDFLLSLPSSHSKTADILTDT